MTLTDRDRKILLYVVPLLLVVVYWFFLLGPKREEAAKAGDELRQQEQARDQARQTLAQLQASRANFDRDYATVVKLGKAIPPQLDMATVLVQLDAAARGTGIRFSKIEVGQRQSAQAASATAGGGGGGSSSQPPVAAGGQQAQSGPGKATEAANNAAQTSAQRNQAAEQSGLNPQDTQTSVSSGKGLPIGGGQAGGAATAGGAMPAPAAGALDSVPLTLRFNGSFMRLADFFHRLKRFVRVAGDRLLVRGRLLTVESLHFTSDSEHFPRIDAELVATVYLAPRSEGATGGATPQGPAPTTNASNQAASGAQNASPAPAATAAR